MLVRAYRLTDRLGIVILKSSAGLSSVMLESMNRLIGTNGEGSGGLVHLLTLLLGLIIGVFSWLLRHIRVGLVTIFGLLLRLSGRTLKTATTSATSAATGTMARRSARSEMETGLAEDPLRVQNRVLSVLIVVVLVMLIGVVIWATGSNNNSTVPIAPNTVNLNAGNEQNLPEQSDNSNASLGLATPVPVATEIPSVLQARGSIAYTVREAGQTDIWVSPIDSRARLRITNSPGDERDATFSPDGTKLAYASNKDGNWEIYIYDLFTGEEVRMTYNLGFEGAPQWSPDGLFLVYESYQSSSGLDIFIMRADGSETPLPIAVSDAADFSPAWSPLRRQIAFTSWRDGNQDIYLFNLDSGEVVNMTNTPNRHEDYPAWSPDGELLTYSAVEAGIETVFVKPTDNPNAEAEVFRRGRTPAFSPDGNSVVFAVDTSEDTRIIVSPYIETGATTEVIQAPLGSYNPDWSSAPLPTELVNSGGLPLGVDPQLYNEVVGADEPPYGLASMVNMEGNLDNAILNDRVNDSFNALRVHANEVIGHDFLGRRITDAYWTLDYRPQPGEERRNWHMTGRAFSFNRRLTVGFPPEIEIVREDGEFATSWRIYVRVAEEAQNGQLGEPLRRMPWRFVTPEDGDVEAYEQGGRLRTEMPKGYYVDLTQLAADYGWSRVAAGADWRSNFNARNFWMFEKRDGLSWYEAMLEIYRESELGGFVPTATPFPTPADSGGA